MDKIKQWAKALKTQLVALSLALKHKDTPLLAKVIGMATILYAISPIDLIPDFIPVLGYLDDVILVPIGIWLTLRLIPPEVWRECQERAKKEEKKKLPKDWRCAIVIVLIWIASALWFCKVCYNIYNGVTWYAMM